MKIFADKNILALQSNFSRHGELHFFDGRTVQQKDLIDADALLVRSITAVDRKLLEGTNIQFVGTATSGIDHVDTDYLRDAGVRFADAKGCNANAVVDYCFTALAFAMVHKNFSLSEARIGIVGAGAVGGLFAEKLEKMGVEVRCCDPYLADGGDTRRDYFSLDSVLECDAVSLHVPLSLSGAYPTQNLLAGPELDKLDRNALLINACRGGVVDEVALRRCLEQRSDIVTVFDVWAGEPTIDGVLARSVDIATPHIAGYSKEAKSNATRILANAFEEHFRLDTDLEQGADDGSSTAAVPLETESREQWPVVLTAFPLLTLSEQFKQALSEGAGAEAFDSFRQRLLQRREFSSTILTGSNYSPEQREQLAILGFQFP